MARNSKQDDLIDRLHADGIRKRVATVIAGGRGGAKKGERQARQLLDQLEDATAAIRTEVLGGKGGGKRSEAGRKAAETRKKNAAKRSAAAKKAAATRKKNKAKA
jgi:hypothetical protein